ncbi:MAG: MBL fold metallo-hydrolase [Acidimicrobiales bacterium]|nr:MBL fold metallo-hydrolase [Acidimicrobiales bacterium]
MPDLLALSAQLLDNADSTQAPNRVTQELSELGDDIALIESFSHVVIFRTDEGLVLFDTSLDATAPACVEAMRAWTDQPVHSIVYTHGHKDHVGGSGAFVADTVARGARAPAIVSHENVAPRFDRYRLTDGYNATINMRQFGGSPIAGGLGTAPSGFLPADVADPTLTYLDTMTMAVGDLTLDLRHAKGETDDHTWAWIPEHKAICVGDFVIWMFPNAGNPQKVQRYPLEWAAALRSMVAQQPELLLPAHGLPVAGAERIATMLNTMADVLETLTRDVLEQMNAGAALNDIVHEVKVDPELLALPYLRPLYDEPEFVINNVWRLYGGWYDGNPARLKPAPDAALAAEVAALAGGVANLTARAVELAASDTEPDLRLACHLIELAADAAPDDTTVRGARADIYTQRRRHETSLMAKGIYRWASDQSAEHAGEA